MTQGNAYTTILQVVSAFISFFSSSIIASTIAWFGIEGATPYRRIILGLSIADIFQSLALLTGPLAVPLDKISWEAKNEAASCQANGFVLQVGATAVVGHTLLLCFYYLCKLKYRMSDEAFKYRFEGKIRACIVVYSFIAGIVPLVMDAYHTNGHTYSFCNIALVPTGCWKESEEVGECDTAHTKRTNILVYYYMIAFPVVCISGIVIIMGMLYNHANMLHKNIQREINVPTTLRGEDKASDGGEDPVDNIEENEENESPQDRVQTLSRLYRKEMTIQATSYVGAFFLMYIPIMAVSTMSYPPEFLLVPAMIFYTLGGFVNILIYTRPKVANVRRRYPECSRLRGFWLVLRAGGEIPDEVDLSVSFCHGCCHAPEWESKYEITVSEDANAGGHNQRPSSFGVRLSSLGF